jgi:hypothetical protein
MAGIGTKVKVALLVLALLGLVFLANALNGQLGPNEEVVDGEVFTVTYELRVCDRPDDCPDYPEPVETTTSSSRPWPWPY